MYNPLKLLFILLALITLSWASAQNLLPTKWKFKTGDNLEWANIAYNDNDWDDILVGKTWESQGYNIDGFAWYRVTVFVPSALKKEAEKLGGLQLNLGKIDDADETYFNGKLVARTGDFPPNFVNKYNADRRFIIPVNQVKWNAPNTIAVRVFDGGGGGGMYTLPVELKVKDAPEKIKVSVAFDRPDFIIAGIGKKSFSTAYKNMQSKPVEMQVNVVVYSDFGDKVMDVTQKHTIAANGHLVYETSLADLPPGFYKATLLVKSPLENKDVMFNFGIEPEKIISNPDREPDFYAYWEKAKAELAAITPDFKITKIDSLSKGDIDVFVVEMKSVGNVRVKAWYHVPKKEGKYPAILNLQGYSSFMDKHQMYSGNDMVVMGLNIRGHGFSKDDYNPGFPGYILTDVFDKEKYVYRGAYMDAARALEFLLSRPEVDKDKIAVSGGSQGGALSIATAALNPEIVKACLPDVPFLSDFRDYFKIAPWPGNEFKDLLKGKPDTEWEKIYKTLSYIDIKNLAPWVKCPVFMGVGLLDDVCPPHINFAAYNLIPAPKSYIIYPRDGHGLPGEHQTTKYLWLKKLWQMQ